MSNPDNAPAVPGKRSDALARALDLLDRYASKDFTVDEVAADRDLLEAVARLNPTNRALMGRMLRTLAAVEVDDTDDGSLDDFVTWARQQEGSS